MGRLVMIGVGLLFATLGNYLGKSKRNFFLGIRTPWTLASDEVWRRTHRLGGWVMVGAGVALVVMGFTGIHQLAFALVIGAAVLVPVIYSFFAYRAGLQAAAGALGLGRPSQLVRPAHSMEVAVQAEPSPGLMA